MIHLNVRNETKKLIRNFDKHPILCCAVDMTCCWGEDEIFFLLFQCHHRVSIMRSK